MSEPRLPDLREISDEQLAERLEYYQANSHALQRAAGDHAGAPVYDSVLWHEILPEVRRRLKERPGPDHGPYVHPDTGERLCVACGTPESDHPVFTGGHCYCRGAFRPQTERPDTPPGQG